MRAARERTSKMHRVDTRYFSLFHGDLPSRGDLFGANAYGMLLQGVYRASMHVLKASRIGGIAQNRVIPNFICGGASLYVRGGFSVALLLAPIFFFETYCPRSASPSRAASRSRTARPTQSSSSRLSSACWKAVVTWSDMADWFA